MREVVQLRVHGVGGNPADGLLGLTKGAATLRVAGDEAAGFYARPDDPHVEGYVWYKLTSGAGIGAMVQVLWILLLPFTLFNVANWMFPDRADQPRRPARVATRSLMFLLGLSLTLSYLLWEYNLVVQQLSYQWRLGGWLDGTAPPPWLKQRLPWLEHPSPLTASVVGMIGVILVGLAVYYVARRTRRDFEKFPGPEQVVDRPPEPSVPLLGHPLSRPEPLDHPSFWWRPKASRRLLMIHVVAGTLMFAGLVAWTIPRAKAGHPSLELRPWFTGLIDAQVVLIVLMLVLYFVGWDWKTHFKWAPPVMVATLSVALTTGFFSGLTFWLARRLDRPDVSLDLDLSAVYGVGAVVFTASLIVWFAMYLIGWRRELRGMADPRPNTALPGAEPNGASPGMRSWIAFLRSVSRGGERFDLLVTPGSVAFVAVAIPVLLLGVGTPSGFDAGIVQFFVRAGRWELLTLVSIALPALIYRAFRPGENAKVKSLWDATTFWPRRFHPFAVRAYGERAVPEIQGRLYEIVVKEERRVVVAARSQGAVLAYCALVHLARWREKITRDVALVTFGCPLHRLHANYFPAYFVYPTDFDGLAKRLFRAADPCVGWKNFYHRTDYAGQEVLDGTKTMSGCDRELPDPAELPTFAGMSVRQPWASPVDVPQPIFTKALVHSYYNNSVELRDWVTTVEVLLAQ